MSDTMRAAFEQWYEHDFMSGLDGPGEWDEERNCYVVFGVHMAWKGWQAAQSQPAPHGVSNIKITIDPSIPKGEAVFRLDGKEVGRITNIAAPAPPVPADVQEIMRLMNGYVRACVQFEEAGRPLESALAEDVASEFKPLEAALTAIVDDNHRLKFELDGVNATRPAPSMTTMQAIYAKAWSRAADWANRHDLHSDVGSPAYLKDMAIELAEFADAAMDGVNAMRRPLTLARVQDLIEQVGDPSARYAWDYPHTDLVRAIEKAHGIEPEQGEVK